MDSIISLCGTAAAGSPQLLMMLQNRMPRKDQRLSNSTPASFEVTQSSPSALQDTRLREDRRNEDISWIKALTDNLNLRGIIICI